MRKKLSSLLGIALFFFFSKGCIDSYIKGGDKQAIANYEKMLSDSFQTVAMLDSEFKEISRKKSGTVVGYDFTYHFTIKGQRYSGAHRFDTLPKIPLIAVY